MTIVAFVKRTKNHPDQAKETRMRFRGVNPLVGEAEVLVHNISELGAVLETDEPFAIGDRIDIKLPQRGATRARVAWTSGRLLGFNFDMPISPVTLDSARLRDAVAITPGGIDTASHIESFGMRVQRLRRALGMSQRQLAKHIGVSVPAVCGWELNRAHPRSERMEALARLLGVSLADLLGDETMPSRSPQIARAREAIARAVGTTPDRVNISIEL
jgi:transcriptional regulator with XRE-family HTH domain